MGSSGERLGFSPAWPLLTFGLSALTVVGIVTIIMVLRYVILPKRLNRVPANNAQ